MQQTFQQRILAFLASVASAYVVAVVLVSQFNIARVQGMGFEVGLGQRLSTVLHDLVGMTASYLPLIVIAFLIAFSFTGLALMRFIQTPKILYPIAGFVAIIAIHSILQMVFGISGVAPTRTTVGLLAQGLAGAIGGYVYWRFRFAKAGTPALHRPPE